ncbi:hypothetical protein T265_12041 [Opisthorchis viverrini]|uniref:Uncharacterized protein n=1 Tax=Opisthorchis viverrini TaxID=6198 RepID=A0A074Z735_OPIVI|nr:hypothetical protein T265_12041 [Opisthorchis viverrini]KER19035.1 hypothetical protein T265_12041 [Opisthorchis viverrini]
MDAPVGRLNLEEAHHGGRFGVTDHLNLVSDECELGFLLTRLVERMPTTRGLNYTLSFLSQPSTTHPALRESVEVDGSSSSLGISENTRGVDDEAHCISLLEKVTAERDQLKATLRER